MDGHHDCMDNTVIRAEELSFSYENAQATILKIGDLEIPKGEFVVLCGPSGSGKSTFLRLLNGLIPDYYAGLLSGQLLVAGLQASQHTVEEFSHSVASVFQNPASQFFHKIVKEELVFPAENQGRKPEIILEKLTELAEEFLLQEYMEREMWNLSGGEKQRVALLTALMQDTPILVLDEPTANLDRAGVEQIKQHLRDLKRQGKTIILAEHRLDYVADLADRYLYFNCGKLEKDWSQEAFLALSEEKRHEMSLRSIHVPELEARLSRSSFKKSLSVQGLRLRAGEKELAYMDHVNFERGSITAIVGANGVGKTTFAHYLLGLFEDKDAKIQLDGQRLSARDRLERTALVMQEVRMQLFADSVKEELLLGLRQAVDTQTVLKELNLAGMENRHPMTLSGGEQQRLVIASQILSDKEVFIFDEPTSGLDFEQMRAVAQVLKKLKEEGKVVILISHDEELLAETADSIVKMRKNDA